MFRIWEEEIRKKWGSMSNSIQCQYEENSVQKEKVLNLFQMVELNKWYCLLGHIFLSVEVDNVTAGTEQW